MRRAAIALLVAAAAAALFFAFRAGDAAWRRGAPERAEAGEGSARADAAGARAQPGAREVWIPAGSGRLDQDAEGRFVPSPDALAFFESVWLASRDLPLAERIERLRAAIQQRLAPDAARDADALMRSWLRYREALGELDEARLAESADLERRLQWVRELRREHFGAALAETLFAEEEQAVAVQAERQAVIENPALAPEERDAQLEALEERLPPPLRDKRARAMEHLEWRAEEEELRAAGGSEAEIEALRARHFGEAAAERLGALEVERADWSARWAAYREERARRSARGPLDAAELEDLRAAHFDPLEIERVRRLEHAEVNRNEPAKRKP